ncbi:hypothetical protein ACFVRD_48265 [Streptomyces sp. NPDC057908]|uniref:hypothetical protein n=1 Tax=Streptomyces sp. NPDC057908 TaxID=3346276 RepID=UPI0036ECA6A0
MFDVERGRNFGLHHNHVPTTLQVYEDHYGRQEVEVREWGSFHVTPAELLRLEAFCTAVTAKIDAVMDGATSGRRLPKQRARRLERAARHLLQAYQRTPSDYGVWEQEADELHLDYVIALEALMASPNDKHDGITERIRSRTAALFRTSAAREAVERKVQEAYSARSRYVHGAVLKDRRRRRSWPNCATSGFSCGRSSCAGSSSPPTIPKTEVTPVVWTHLTMDLDGPGRCRSTWQGPRSTVRSSGPTR